VSELRIAIVGFGRIARTQHVLAVAATLLSGDRA